MYEEYVEYTADDEEPDCMLCNYVTGGFDCWRFCGATNFWNGYRRTEKIIFDDDEIEYIQQLLERLKRY